MNRHVWPIQGYGIKIKKNMFDISKLRQLTDLNEEEYEDLTKEDGGISLFEDGFLEEVLENISPILQLGETGNFHQGTYLLYSFKAPWDLGPSEKYISKRNIANEIENTLLIYLKDEFDREWLDKSIHYISTAGGV